MPNWKISSKEAWIHQTLKSNSSTVLPKQTIRWLKYAGMKNDNLKPLGHQVINNDCNDNSNAD
jgi:hypothetical protein